MKNALTFIVALSLAVIPAASRKAKTVNAPDFAYPRTVLASADSLYKVAVKSGDDVMCLDALMQQAEANRLIDADTRGESINRAMTEASGIRDKQMHALYDLYAARLLTNYYNSSRWTFDRRSLPLNPRPADYAEWSGDMFRHVIDSLCSQAWSNAGEMPLSSLKRVIAADDLTCRYFPVLSDFAANAILAMPVSQELKNRVEDQNFNRQTPGTAPYYYLLAKKIEDKGVPEVAETFLKAKDRYNALVLWQFVNVFEARFLKPAEVATITEALTEAKKVAANSWADGLVTNLINTLKSPSFSLSRTGILPANADFKVNLSRMVNVDTLVIRCLRFASYDAALKYQSRNTGKPLNTKSFTFDMRACSESSDHDTTVTANLPAGYYLLYAEADGKKLNGSLLATVSNVVVVRTMSQDGTDFTVFDAISGKPVKDAVLSLVRDGKTVYSVRTPSTGRVSMKTSRQGNVQVTADGITTLFNNIYYYKADNSRQNVTSRTARVTFTTNLGVYHPGDTARWAGVVCVRDSVASGQRFNVILRNADGKEVDTATVTSDSFGRVIGSFPIPKEGKTGGFSMIARGIKQHGEVGGYGSFQVSDFNPNAIIISDFIAWPGKNVADSVVVSGCVKTYSGAPLTRSAVSLRIESGDSTAVSEGITGSDGRFVLSSLIPGKERYCMAIANVTAPDGTVQTVSTGFDRRFANRLLTDIGYGRNIDVNNDLAFSAVVVNPVGDTIPAPLKWELSLDKKNIAGGSLNGGKDCRIKFPKNAAPDNYNLVLIPADTTLCEPVSTNVILYDTHSSVLPFKDNIFWMPSDSVIAVSNPGAIINVMYNDRGGRPVYVSRKVGEGYHRISDVFELNDCRGGNVTYYAVRDGKYQEESMSLPERAEGIKVNISSFRDKTEAGGTEQWTVEVRDTNDKPVEAAVVLNVYDSRLDRLAVPSFLNIYRANRRPFWSGVSFSYDYLRTDYMYICKWLKETTVGVPEWRYLNSTFQVRGRMMAKSARMYGARAAKDEAVYDSEEPVLAEMVVSERAPLSSAGATNDMSAESTAETEDAGDLSNERGAGSLDDVVLRRDDVFNALWMPDATTDAAGKLPVTFRVPNANTTWTVTCQAWTRAGYSGRLTRKIISSKPVMVQLNAPRFVREGDIVTVLATVINNSDLARDILVRSESAADSAEAVKVEKTVTVAGGSQVTVPVSVVVPALAKEMTFTVRAVSGDFSDGERKSIPVLESQSRVTETQNFYMNPGETARIILLPEGKGADYQAELTFTENPMWTVVSALPSVAGKEVWPTAGAQARAYFAAATVLGLMKDHPELELKFSKSELRSIMTASRNRLRDLQTADGGWRWGPWSSRSSEYVTGDVLDMMGTLLRHGYLDDNSMMKMIEKALPFYDDNVRGTDIFYTIVRSAFSRPAQSLNGRKVAAATIQDIIKNWKSYGISNKALAACALWYNDNRNMAGTLMGSLDQFGTQTPTKGFEFKNIRSLQAYAWLLEAYANIQPKSPRVDGLRQYLIVRKQAEDWGNSVITTDIVASMISSGTPWTTSSEGVTVTVDGQKKVIAAENRQGTFTIPVMGNSVTVTRQGKAATPSYGAVITRYTASNADIKAYSDGEISIEKRLYVRNADGSWRNFNAATDSLRVGERVKTQLVIKSDRPMSNVVVADDRAATFEPVVQLSGWVYGDGIMAYRENRDSVTNLFLDYVPKGTYLLEYQFNVNNAGRFSSGIASVTCTQAPTLTAHSSGETITVAQALK